ncbi:MAG: agmatinase [Gemmatimonadales bacterium]|nr:agmatinase [Gemmatimonadales bacterium]
MTSERRRPTLIGLPYDASSSFQRGAADAPPLIRAALASPASNAWSELGIETGGVTALADAGDLELPPTGAARTMIEAGVRRVLDQDGRPIALGGDHSVTYPILRAIRPGWPDLTIVHLDAHPDLYPEFDGDPFSHACPFARIMEERLTDRLVQVGIRTMNEMQRIEAERHGVEVIDMPAWAGGQRPHIRGPVYVSVDIDVLDPAFAPGVSHREPGGLSVREVLTLLQSLPSPVVGADIVEFNPTQDPSGLTASVCAKLVKELAGHMLAGN